MRPRPSVTLPSEICHPLFSGNAVFIDTPDYGDIINDPVYPYFSRGIRVVDYQSETLGLFRYTLDDKGRVDIISLAGKFHGNRFAVLKVRTGYLHSLASFCNLFWQYYAKRASLAFFRFYPDLTFMPFYDLFSYR